MDTLEAIKSRRSIRKYKRTAIHESELREVLEAARWAPSWANTQCWELVVVTEPDIRKKLSETFSGGNPGAVAVAEAPVVIVALAKKGLSGFFKGQAQTDKGDWMLFDVGIAMQNLALAAHAKGMATCHMGAFDSAKVAQILGVPQDVAVVEMTPLGYPDVDAKQPKRKELSEFVHRERYGKKA